MKREIKKRVVHKEWRAVYAFFSDQFNELNIDTMFTHIRMGNYKPIHDIVGIHRFHIFTIDLSHTLVCQRTHIDKYILVRVHALYHDGSIM